MAHTTTYVGTTTQTNLPAIFRQLVGQVRARLAIRRRRMQLHWELTQCSDRELADMAMSRADIDSIVARSLNG